MGKTVATNFMDNLVEKNVVKLDKAEKEKFYNAKTHEKAQILMSSMRDKHHENSQKLQQTLLNFGQYSTELQGKTALTHYDISAVRPTQCPLGWAILPFLLFHFP